MLTGTFKADSDSFERTVEGEAGGRVVVQAFKRKDGSGVLEIAHNGKMGPGDLCGLLAIVSSRLGLTPE